MFRQSRFSSLVLCKRNDLEVLYLAKYFGLNYLLSKSLVDATGRGNKLSKIVKGQL